MNSPKTVREYLAAHKLAAELLLKELDRMTRTPSFEADKERAGQ